jgi:type IV pilus assembly protein PilZ
MVEHGRERRESRRAAIELPIQYERLNALLADYTHNISRGGTFIRTERPMKVGTALRFSIEAPGLGEPLVIRGSVRWVVQPSEASDERPAGMGIEFAFESDSDKARLEARLDRLMAASLGPTAFEKLMGKPAPKPEGTD